MWRNVVSVEGATSLITSGNAAQMHSVLTTILTRRLHAEPDQQTRELKEMNGRRH